jgi:ABC-type multidrug transport system fused ATPase/permease subunit
MIDSVAKEDEGESILQKMVLSLFVIVLIMGIMSAIRAYCYHIAGERVVAKLRKKLFETIVVQEVAFFDMTKTGELLNRLSSDTKALENAVTVNVSMGVRYVIQVGCIVVIRVLYFTDHWRCSHFILHFMEIMFGHACCRTCHSHWCCILW